MEGDNQILGTFLVDKQKSEIKKPDIKVYDFCIVWNWEYDYDFVQLLEKSCKAYNFSLLQITQYNVNELITSLQNKELSFRVYLDRGSDADTAFLPIVQWVKENNIYSLNPFELSCRSADKAIMHPVFIHAGLYTPYTFILPSYDEQPDIEIPDLSILGKQFIMKPANGSGGIGVVKKLNTKEQVLEVRKNFHNDKYLIQKNIIPKLINGKPAWFRVIYCAGNVYSSWWDPSTHIYEKVSEEEISLYNLSEIRTITNKIAVVSGLTLFSTEIAYTEENLFIVVDYVNDPVDLRLNSKACDGVPDSFVQSIASNIVEFAAKKIGIIN